MDISSLQNYIQVKNFYPDMSTGVAITSGYVTEYDGWIRVLSASNGCRVSINGVEVYHPQFTYDGVDGGLFPVKKGSTVDWSALNSIILYANEGF